MKIAFAWVALVFVLGCSSVIPPRIDMVAPTSALKLNAIVQSAMVRTVSLPTYAAAEEVAFETSSGLISQNNNLLWADDPARAVTLTIARQLDNILTADVSPEPWPFVNLPDVAIDVRVSRMIAGRNGNFSLEGQYYVGGDGIDFPNSTTSFAIQVPLTSSQSAEIAQAQAKAILRLSEKIAYSLDR